MMSELVRLDLGDLRNTHFLGQRNKCLPLIICYVSNCHIVVDKIVITVKMSQFLFQFDSFLCFTV